ncbi:unnamed protein product [Brassica oleracea var. botrytis]|uniref:(rape) hypothetical protein n=1 Tax=Brassica napus TaxID=3708 RepID=A0A078FHY7_BRANA|nr:unnamed protein product [Brassica napus]CAF1919234.1 unnamed protein product [Brassica napus]CAF2057968.1 unnamed protein product [Brassica napus]CDY11703.1 BnaC06g13110D [Brassica napus]CDY36701.1 BnaC02g31220D [Brassica napus]
MANSSTLLADLDEKVPSPAGDASDMAVFVSFNTAIAQLSNVRAAEVCNSLEC